MLLKVIIASDFWVLKLVQYLLSILADRVHNMMHEFIFVGEHLLENLLNISLNRKQISLDSSSVEYRETTTVPKWWSLWLLFGSGIVQQEHLQI